MKKLRTISLIAAITAAIMCGTYLTGTLLRPAGAISTSDILKVGGVLLIVNQLGDDINHFVNKLLSQRRAEAFGATKVVPIVSVGQGAYIGAAQVVGVPKLVQRVQAVAAVEGVLNKFDGTLLVPISTQMPGKNLARVEGVGVSAVLDVKL